MPRTLSRSSSHRPGTREGGRGQKSYLLLFVEAEPADAINLDCDPSCKHLPTSPAVAYCGCIVSRAVLRFRPFRAGLALKSLRRAASSPSTARR